MAKKPAIAYGVARKTFSRVFEVFEITKDSPSRRIVYGRGEDGEPSSRAERDVVVRYPTRDMAKAALGALQAIQRHHDPIVQAASAAHSKAMRDREEALSRAAAELRISGMNHDEPVQP